MNKNIYLSLISVMLLVGCEEEPVPETGDCKVTIIDNVPQLLSYPADIKANTLLATFTPESPKSCDASQIRWTQDVGFDPWILHDTMWTLDDVEKERYSAAWVKSINSGSNEYPGLTKVTASIPGGVSDTFTIYNNKFDTMYATTYGMTPEDAITVLYNYKTKKYDQMPFWYLLHKVSNDVDMGMSDYQDSWRSLAKFKPHKSNYKQIEWIRFGMQYINNRWYFDAYKSLEYLGYPILDVPDMAKFGKQSLSSQQIEQLKLQKNGPVSTQATPPPAKPGDIFLGNDQNINLWETPLNSFTHSAIRTTVAGQYMEAAGIDKGGKYFDPDRWKWYGVGLTTFSSLQNRFKVRQVLLSNIYSTETDNIKAAQWAMDQKGKPYSFKEVPHILPNLDKYNGFYCSLLVWAAHFHSSNGRIDLRLQSPIYNTIFSGRMMLYITPADLYGSIYTKKYWDYRGP